MELDLARYFLPERILEYFTVVSINEKEGKTTNKKIIEIQLEEKNQLPDGYSTTDYESKGFSSSSRIQDFPIRGKAVYLVIKRRRWRHKETRKEIRGDYSFIAEGSKLTQELSGFLKGTGRGPRRYDK